MGSVHHLAEQIRAGLGQALPGIRKVLLDNLPLLIAALLLARTANTSELAERLPLETESSDIRQQRLRRLLSNKFIDVKMLMAPFAKAVLREIMGSGLPIELLMDQSDLGDNYAVLMISVRFGDRALPLIWLVEEGAANIGARDQINLLNTVLGWIPKGARVRLLGDRFYPTKVLFEWLKRHKWQYRIRLKSNYVVILKTGERTTAGELLGGYGERYEDEVLLFDGHVQSNIGAIWETGHEEAWIIAMDCEPTLEAVLSYGGRWPIEPMFSDFKSRGFGLEDTRLEDKKRVSALILAMALAMHWCVRTGFEDAKNNPTPAEEKAREQLEALEEEEIINEVEDQIVEPVVNEAVETECDTNNIDNNNDNNDNDYKNENLNNTNENTKDTTGQYEPPRRRNWITRAYEKLQVLQASGRVKGKKTWAIKKAYRSMLSWFKRGLRLLVRRAENGGPIPPFWVASGN